MENVILVDEKDNQIGVEEKLEAHSNGGRLHRAISVLLFNENGKTLLQKRAMVKYHSKGQWSNTCCSHPKEGESTIDAARRRLAEEMGVDCDNLKEAYSFIYHVDVGEGLRENEFDHVFFGRYDGKPRPNPEEVSDCRWAALEDIKRDAEAHQELYTPWFRIMLNDSLAERAKAYLSA